MDEDRKRTPATLQDILSAADNINVLTSDLAALAAWLFSFAPANARQELDALVVKAQSYTHAIMAIRGLDLLLSESWHTPRQYISEPLTLIQHLIAIRLEAGTGDSQRLRQVEEAIRTTLQLEARAAHRRGEQQHRNNPEPDHPAPTDEPPTSPTS